MREKKICPVEVQACLLGWWAGVRTWVVIVLSRVKFYSPFVCGKRERGREGGREGGSEGRCMKGNPLSVTIT